MSIDSYCINYINERISIYENNNGKLEVLKKNGEETQEFVSAHFWQWFKEKINYSSQSISFVVVTDKENFVIDNSIKIAKENRFFSSDISIKMIQEQSKGFNILTFPKVNDFDKNNAHSVDNGIVVNKLSITSSNLASFFRNKTESYKHE